MPTSTFLVMLSDESRLIQSGSSGLAGEKIKNNPITKKLTIHSQREISRLGSLF